MTRWPEKLGALVLGAALLDPLTATVANAADPPAPAAVSITSLPFSAGSSGTLSQLATPATEDADLAVAAACVPGGQIAAPQWARLDPAAATTILARTQPTSAQGRDQFALPGGVALVSTTTGQVLACSVKTGLSQVGPAEVGPEGVYVVAFHVASGPWGNQSLDYPSYLPLYVDETTGVRPANDDLAAATPVRALPFTDTVDRYAATPEAADMGWVGGNFCGSSVPGVHAVHRSTWYRFVLAGPAVLNPSTDTSSPFLRLSGAAQLAEVTADGLSSVECQSVRTNEHPTVLKAGTPYLVQVADHAPYGPPEGPTDQGALRTLSLDGTARLLAAPTVSAVASAGLLDPRTAGATVSGTVSCRGGFVRSVSIRGSVVQSGARGAVEAAFSATPSLLCDGTVQPWRATAVPTTGRFAQGDATVQASAEAANAAGTARGTVRRVVLRLAPAGRAPGV